MSIGRFSPHPAPDERRLYTPTFGLRFYRIEVACTTADFVSPRFHEWVSESLLCRLADLRTGVLVIEVRP